MQFGNDITRRHRQLPRSDPIGFVVLTRFPFGGFHVAWCRSDSGAEISKRNSVGTGCECHIIPVSDLLAWHKSGVDELEAMLKL